MNYVNLHAHLHRGSTLDSIITAEEYMSRLKELGMDYGAITDHGTTTGHRDFQREAKKAGIKPILGLEAYVTEDRFDKRAAKSRNDGTTIYNHITILALNENGLNNLNALNEEAWQTGYYYKARMDHQMLFDNNKDLIVLSGCLNGPICKAIEAGQETEAIEIATRYKDALGDRFYIELMSHNPIATNMALLAIADQLDIKVVSTADCHYARKEDLWVEEAMLILSTNPKKNPDSVLSEAKKMDILERYNYLYPDRTMTFQEIEIYLKDRETDEQLYQAQGIHRPDMFYNTWEIAQRVGEYPYHEGLDLLPRPEAGDPMELLTTMVNAGLQKRNLLDDQRYIDRRDYELDIIEKKNFPMYFIMVADIIQWAKAQGIRVGPCRGSSGAFLVNYACDITALDPIELDLMPERFLSMDRIDYPDIDIDIQDNRREEVIHYVQGKYGYVAGISTEILFNGKSAIRDAARVFDIPLSDVNRALKNNDAPPNVDFDDHFLSTDQGRNFNMKHPEVMKLAKALSGRVRSRGTHPSGIVVSRENISRFAALETAKNPRDDKGPRVPIVANDMVEVAKIGLIKIDFLGLKTLSVIDDTVKMIATNKHVEIDTDNLPQDPAVYKMLADGYTKGIFQCEQSASTRVIKQVAVSNFDELYATNALVRPGVASSSFYQKYIDGRNGEVSYIHADVKKTTEATYGSILFQEQLMKICVDLASMTAIESDNVRKAVGKKKPEELAKWGPAFIEGAAKKIGLQKAKALWKDIEASGAYMFNKTHSYGYSLLSYQTAWLKYHYPQEFMSALIRNEEDKDKLTEYYIEAKRMGLKIYLPDVNKSELRTSVERDGIRMGLNSIKFISDNVGQKIINARPFTSFEELDAASRVKYSGLNSRAVNALKVVGAATFPDNPKTGTEREYFYEYLNLPVSSTILSEEAKVNITPIEWYSEENPMVISGLMREIKRGPGWALVDFLDETGSTGVFADHKIELEPGQTYVVLTANKRIFRYLTAEELMANQDNIFARYVRGEIIPPEHEEEYIAVSFKKHTTKKGATMAYMVVLCSDGVLRHVTVWPSQYNQVLLRCRPGVSFKAEMNAKENTMTLEKFI